MSFAPLNTCFAPAGDGSILGSFVNKDFNTFFEFSTAQEDEQVFGPRFNVKVWLLDGTQFRLAEVKKTVAFVVVDEAADGSVVVEKWNLKQRRDFVAN